MITPWTPETIERLAEMWVHGDKVISIALELGLHESQVVSKVKHMRDAGDPRFAVRPRYKR